VTQGRQALEPIEGGIQVVELVETNVQRDQRRQVVHPCLERFQLVEAEPEVLDGRSAAPG